MEIWKDIKGYEGSYQVSDLGRVRGLDRVICDGRRLKGRLLSMYINPANGYAQINLSLNGKTKLYEVHKLVAIAFLNHEPCGLKLVVDHIDNDKLNNKLSNLQLISHRENSSKDRLPNSGYTGVITLGDRFAAQINIDGKSYKLGTFDSVEKASEAYINSLSDYQNGEFNHKKYNPFKPKYKYKNVVFKSKKFECNIMIYGKRYYLGRFQTEYEAHLMYVKAKRNTHLANSNANEFRELLKKL